MEIEEGPLIVKVREHASVESIIQTINANYKINLDPNNKKGAKASDQETLDVLHNVVLAAVDTDYVGLVKHLYQCGFHKIEVTATKNRLYRNKNSIFQSVCEKGNIDMMKVILPYKPNLYSMSVVDKEYINYHTDTPFKTAVQHDDVEILKLLLPLYNKQRHKNRCNDYPLHVATERGAMKCFKFLIEKYPREVNARNWYGYTPLLFAVRRGIEFVKPLIHAGAGISPRICQKICLCSCCLSSVEGEFIHEDTPEIVKLLIEEGADIHATDSSFETPLTVLCRGYIRELEDRCRCKMKYSLEKHHQLITETAKVLLNAGCDPMFGTFHVVTNVLIEAIIMSWEKLTKRFPFGNLVSDTDNQKEEIKLSGDHAYQTLLLILQNSGNLDCKSRGAIDLIVKFLNKHYGFSGSQWQSIWPNIMKCTKTLLLYGATSLTIIDLFFGQFYSQSLVCMISRCLDAPQRRLLDKCLQEKCEETLNVNDAIYFNKLLSEISKPKKLADACRMIILSKLPRPIEQMHKLGLPPVLVEYTLAIDSEF